MSWACVSLETLGEVPTACAADKDGDLRADQGDARQMVKIFKFVVCA